MPTKHDFVRNRTAWALLAAVGATLAGCGSGSGGQRASDDADAPPTRVRTDDSDSGVRPMPRGRTAIALYNSGDFAAAKTQAEIEARRFDGADRERALLIAGMSAAALGQTGAAEEHLRPLTRSSDREISGRAGAALGVMALEAGRYESAAGLLTVASRRLTGDEAAKAAMFAGDAMAAQNRVDSARSQYALASGMASDPTLKRMIASRLERGEFSIQVGVFSLRQNAERAAAEADARAQAHGIGRSRIVTRTDANGRPQYVVQLGRFNSRQAAADARARLGEGGLVALAPGE